MEARGFFEGERGRFFERERGGSWRGERCRSRIEGGLGGGRSEGIGKRVFERVNEERRLERGFRWSVREDLDRVLFTFQERHQKEIVEPPPARFAAPRPLTR